jgi:hypothetical protein
LIGWIELVNKVAAFDVDIVAETEELVKIDTGVEIDVVTIETAPFMFVLIQL